MATGWSPGRFAILASIALVSSCADAPALHEQTGFVMGTVAQLKVVSGDAPSAERALAGALRELQRIEELTTSYSETSEVSRLVAAGTADVGSELGEILADARTVTERSRGAFDPSAGGLVALWGFLGEPALPDSAAIDSARTFVGPQTWGRAEGSPSARAAWTVHPGTLLDLGGIAKGWAVDHVADRLAERFGSCLVNAGGDLAVRGSRPGGDPWRIGIQDPRDPSLLFLRIRLSGNRAIATSGDYQRYFESGGRRYHHILDPRTGWPASGVRSVSVIAPTCAGADAWATAAFVLGLDDGLAALETEPGVEGVLVTEDGNGELVLHETAGFAAYRAD